MLVEFVGSLVVVALDGGFFDGAVHALDPAVGPRVRRLGQPVLHPEGPADAGNSVAAGKPLVGLQRELYPVVGQYGVGFVRQLVPYPPQKIRRDHARRPRVQLRKRRFAGAVDGHKNAHEAFGRYWRPSSVRTSAKST